MQLRRIGYRIGLPDPPRISSKASAPFVVKDMTAEQFAKLKNVLPMAPRGSAPVLMSAEEFLAKYPPKNGRQ